MKDRGYIGYGIVREEACMVKEFKLDNGQYLLNQNLTEPNLAHDLHDPEKCEWAVKVEISVYDPVESISDYPDEDEEKMILGFYWYVFWSPKSVNLQ